MKKRYFIFMATFLCLNMLTLQGFCQTKSPDFAQMYLGTDKFENFNRKMFIFNNKLNKYALKPITVVWSSIVPKYGMDRLKCAYSNILYPRYLVSSIAQKDFKEAGKATARFITNSTVGLGGMYDPAKRFLKLKPANEDMEQALAKWKIKSGPYLVIPVLSSTTPRGLLGRAMDAALDPTSYVGSPIIAGVKAGFTINNATLMQPLAKFLENNYIDPYDIAKKMYGLSVAILNSNLNRDEEIEKASQKADEEKLLGDIAKEEDYFIEVNDEKKFEISDAIKGFASTEEFFYDDNLIPDIILKNFNPQHPVIDSMRTVLFEVEGIDKSFWGESSIWNKSFRNRIKEDEIAIYEGRDKYKFRYIMQNKKDAPVAIIYPSVGEGIYSHHSDIFAKIFYDEGYSVIIQGSAFNYNFLKSMPENYRPGIPQNDVKHLQKTTSKIVNSLEEKFNCKFKDKVVLGTSFGAMSSLFLADLEAKDNSLNISKYISINPPIELLYAMDVIDKNTEDWDKNPNNLKEKTSLTAAKILQAAERKNDGEKFETLPFSLEEAKLITGFVLHQKLSDILFAIEKAPVNKKSDFYEKVANLNYKDYAQKYLVGEGHPTIEDFSNTASLHSIKDFLKNNKNYRIYHTLDDYLVNNNQLKKLKEYSRENMKLIDTGAHLGFLYREEFIDDLKKEISLKEKPRL